jgi:hypothetical protein
MVSPIFFLYFSNFLLLVFCLFFYIILSPLYIQCPPRELLYQFQFPFIECYSVDSAAQQTQQLAHKSPLISGIVCALCVRSRGHPSTKRQQHRSS